MSRVFDIIRDEHKTEIVPVMCDVRLNKGVQRQLWGGLDNTAHIRMGLFYELMTAGLFGGEVIDSLIKSEECMYGHLKPDVINDIDKKVYESKASRMGHQLNLVYEQVYRYHIFMVKYPQYEISFAIWGTVLKA